MQLMVAGQAVADPITMWRRYAQVHGATLRDYDFVLAGDPNVLTAQEAYRSRIINSRITKAESVHLEQRALGAAWHEVPGDADLADADPARLAACSRRWHSSTGTSRGQSRSMEYVSPRFTRYCTAPQTASAVPDP
jgi:hypothetical protein